MEAPTLPPASLPPAPPPLPGHPGHDDAGQLRVLSILHYVLAGITAFFSLFPIIYVVLGIAMMTDSIPVDGGAANALGAKAVGAMFVAMATFFIALGMTLAGLMVHTGRCLVQRRRHTLCMVVAGLCCLCFPLGTALGVFSLVVLSRPSVRARFEPAATPA